MRFPFHDTMLRSLLANAGNVMAGRVAIPSICTAHPHVLQIAMQHAAEHGDILLIEATCNQVNQFGGYTGLTPALFRDRMLELAADTGLAPENLVLGGDHLGPNPWKHLPADEAMSNAEAMIAAYAAAGFRKLHLDASMGCAGEPEVLDDENVAQRAARLAAVAERVCHEQGLALPVYIIGTEVPPPGGATASHNGLTITPPEAAMRTVDVHHATFKQHGLEGVLERIVGLVVQPGVEFGDEGIDIYEPGKAAPLGAALRNLQGLVFEAHSTDYQPGERLRALALEGFGILKVGPALTFAWREAIYGLDRINAALEGTAPELDAKMEALMMRDPGYWRPYYKGSDDYVRLQRHYSYSDRIRYYWPEPDARAAVEALLGKLGDRALPQTLISQHLGRLYGRVVAGGIQPDARSLIAASVRDVLDVYRQASAAA